MKKIFLSIFIIIFAIVILSFKHLFLVDILKEIDINIKSQIIKNVEETKDNNIFKKDFGTYRLPNNWVESEEHSTENKFFYILQDDEDKERPNNISINEGKNRYSKLNHKQFKEAILRQLNMQINGEDDITINASGSYTDNNYILYTFVINEQNENITTIQYYIVGDYKYILIQETVFGESEETDNAAEEIVNSFKWN